MASKKAPFGYKPKGAFFKRSDLPSDGANTPKAF